jgi:hypothetical protein
MADQPNNSGSTKSLRLLSLKPEKDGHLTFKMPEDLTTCTCGTPTQDGSKSSDIKVKILSTSKTEKFWMYGKVKTLKDKMWLFIRDITV